MTAAELAAKGYVEDWLNRGYSVEAQNVRMLLDALERELDDALGRIEELATLVDDLEGEIEELER